MRHRLIGGAFLWSFVRLLRIFKNGSLVGDHPQCNVFFHAKRMSYIEAVIAMTEQLIGWAWVHFPPHLLERRAR